MPHARKLSCEICVCVLAAHSVAVVKLIVFNTVGSIYEILYIKPLLENYYSRGYRAALSVYGMTGFGKTLSANHKEDFFTLILTEG